MQLGKIKTEYAPTADLRWLHNVESTVPWNITGTLDSSLGFVAGTHYPSGWMRQGLPLGLKSTTKTFGLYDNAATDGRETCVGLLYTQLQVVPGKTLYGVAVVMHAMINPAFLPVPIDANGWTDLGARIFRNPVL